jgi:undecaprenyl-diphosphatase
MRGLVIFTAQYLYLAIIAIALIEAICAKATTRAAFIRLSAISLPLAFIVDKILNYIISNPRPFVVEGIAPLFPHSPDNGFPSDHTLLVMTVAAIVFTYNRKLGVVLGILGLLVGVARVLAKVHHPMDIAGSAIIAVISVYTVNRLLLKNITSLNR